MKYKTVLKTSMKAVLEAWYSKYQHCTRVCNML